MVSRRRRVIYTQTQKKKTSFFYNTFLGCINRVPDKNYKIQRLLLGTHTNDDEPNYLQIASVRLPKEKESEDTIMEDTSGKRFYFLIQKKKANLFFL